MSNIADPVGDLDRARLRELVSRHGEVHVLKHVGLDRLTLARALAGLGVRRGTAAQIREALSRLEGHAGEPLAISFATQGMRAQR